MREAIGSRFLDRNDAGPAQDIDGSGAGAPEGSGAGRSGGAAGIDVVDEDDPAAGEGGTGFGRDPEGASDGERALAPAEALERRRGAGAAQEVEPGGQAGAAR